MKTTTVAALILAFWTLCFTESSSAQDAQQRMRDCATQAADKGLKGADRRTFMSGCLRAAPAADAAAPAARPVKLEPGTPPLHALMAYGSMAKLTVMEGNLDAQLGKSDDWLQKNTELRAIGGQIDDVIPAAVKQAKGKQDLAKAAKDYYSAVTKYIANGIPNSKLEKIVSDRLEAEVDAADKTLELEMKLAGIK